MMKVLLVAAKKDDGFSPFVTEQMEALVQLGAEVVAYAHSAHGVGQYAMEISKLRSAIKEIKPNVIHAHFGLTGLLAGLAALWTGVPVVVTYHGCDINDKKLRPFSRIAMQLAEWNIFVSKRQIVNAYGSERQAGKSTKKCIIPCGINLSQFDSGMVNDAWFDSRFEKGNYVLFAGSYDSYVKNSGLAKQAVAIANKFEIGNLKSEIKSNEINLIELKGYTREQVVTLMFRSKALLLTSIREGSPQVIKEAMACGCPIVSVDVGDVEERTAGVGGCYVIPIGETSSMAEKTGRRVKGGCCVWED